MGHVNSDQVVREYTTLSLDEESWPIICVNVLVFDELATDDDERFVVTSVTNFSSA